MLRQLLAGRLDPAEALSWIVAIAVALTVHEFAHAKRADMAGDPTPRSQGRVSLNPLDHYDPIGTTMILLFGIGWGKPVPVNPLAFRRPRWDALMVSLWGPLSNIITAVAFAVPVRLAIAGPYEGPLRTIVMLNLFLALFNLLPVGPLDGGHVLASLLPARAARKFEEFSARWGMVLLLLIIVTPVADYLVFLPTYLLMALFTGGLF